MRLRALLLTSSLAMTSTALAYAQPASECFTAAEAGQTARDAGKYSRARDEFAKCAKDPCPELVQRDCSQWLEQLAQMWPTLVIRADAAGQDVAAVKVLIDNKIVSERLDGRPMEVEPGEHTLRCETQGLPPSEEKLVVTSGEKNRVINVHFKVPKVPPPVTRPRSKVPLILGVGFTALAVGGFVTDAVLGGIALGKYNDMKSTCAPTGSCDRSAVEGMQTQFLIGDVALGVGLASAIVATVFVVVASSSKATQTTLRAGIGPSPGGGTAFIAGTF